MAQESGTALPAAPWDGLVVIQHCPRCHSLGSPVSSCSEVLLRLGKLFSGTAV